MFSSGKCYFRGPWFVTPPEIPPIPGRMFYKQEVFLSTVEDTNPLVSIIGKCAVLDYNDYISCKIYKFVLHGLSLKSIAVFQVDQQKYQNLMFTFAHQFMMKLTGR